MKSFYLPLLIIFFSQNILNAQIAEESVSDTKFWATGKLKPISMYQSRLDARVAFKTEEDYNGTAWYKTGSDTSVLINNCSARSLNFKYSGSQSIPLRLNVRDSFGYTNNRLNLQSSLVYNTSNNPPTLSSTITNAFFYLINSTRSEPDSIVTTTVSGATSTIRSKTATFVNNNIETITNISRNGAAFIPTTRTTYKYGTSNLTDIVVATWSAANKSWVACPTCENYTMTYDANNRLIQQINNNSSGDSVRYIITYVGTTSRVKSITNQFKSTGTTTTWTTNWQATSTSQNTAGYPINIDYGESGDSIKIGFTYTADSLMTQRLTTIKPFGGTTFTNLNRIIQVFCTPCTQSNPVIQSQPTPTITAYIGQAPQSFGIAGANITLYAWQISKNNGTTWNLINTSDTTEYIIGSYGNATSGGSFVTIKNPTLAQNGYRFRVNVFNGCAGPVISNVGTLIVENCTNPIPTIQSQPTSLTRNVGQSAVFSVTATNTANYTWYYYIPTDSLTRYTISPTDTTFTGQNTNTLTLKYVKSTYSGYRFGCLLTNGCVSNIATSIAGLTVSTACTALTPAVQYNSGNFTAYAGQYGSGMIITGTNFLTAQWQVQVTGDTIWQNIAPTDTTYFINNSQNNASFVIKYPKITQNGYKYRAILNNSCANLFSSVGVLTVLACPTAAPQTQTQPNNVATAAGNNATFQISASNAADYWWQISTNGGTTWTFISQTDSVNYTGVKTPTLIAKSVKTTMNNYRYRCQLQSPCFAPVFTNAAILTVGASAVNDIDAKVKIYPNPTDNILYLDMPYTQFKVTLSDSKGSVILRSENKTQISIGELPSGLYFMNIKTENGETTKKVVKY
jgi:hypothetical protein